MLLSLPLLLLAPDVALVGGTVHTMVPGEEPRVATVLIEGKRITLVAPDIELPAGTERFDVAGRHLVPGLIDAMVSFDRDHDALYVGAGITVVRDIGGLRVQNLLERRPEARERTPGPTLYSAGVPLDGDPPGSREAAIVRNAASAEGVLSIVLQDEPDFLHLMSNLSADAHRALLAEAARHDIAAWGPVPSCMGVLDALDAGQRGFLYLDQLLPRGADWSVVRPAAFDEVVARFQATGAALVPVLHAPAAQLVNENEDPRFTALLGLLAPFYEQWWTTEAYQRAGQLTPEVVADGERGLARRRELLRRLHGAGVALVPGSGAPLPWLFPGQALHQELAEWVRAGIDPADVLELATRGAAEALGIDDDHGTIAPGKVADVICVDADPRLDLRVLLDPRLVVLRGRVLDRAQLDDQLETLRQEQRAIRERLAEPLVVGEPPKPEGDVVLAGQVETFALRHRLSAERFLVVRLPEGGVALTGRIVYPDPTGRLLSEMAVEQDLVRGRLERFLVTHRQENRVLTCEGIRFGQSFRIQRRLDGVLLKGTEVARGDIRTLDVDSVTSLLALGQIDVPGDYTDFQVLSLHEMMVPETSTWRMQLDDGGDHQVRTHQGQLAFRLDVEGIPRVARLLVGQMITETRLVEASTLGGPGFPLPPAKAKRVAEARARAAAAAAEAKAGDAGPAPETGETDETDEGSGGDG